MKEGAGMALSRAAKSLDPKVTFLRSLPAFSGLRDRDIVSLSSLFDEVRIEAGERLVRGGEPGHELFLLPDGLALPSLREEALATIGGGGVGGGGLPRGRGPCPSSRRSCRRGRDRWPGRPRSWRPWLR